MNIRLPRIFSSFRHRNYRLWFSGQLVSVSGTWMKTIALGWLVYQLTSSEFMLGLVGFASAIPVLLVSPWGGVISDTLPNRTILLATQAAAMLLAFTLAALTFSGVIQVWHILILAAVLGVINAFDAPARQSFVVTLVGREDMVNGIALNSVMLNSGRVIGPALGGYLLTWLGAAWCFLINGFTFIGVISGLLAMRLPPQPAVRRIEKPLQQFAEGLRYASQQPEIFGLVLMAAIFSIFGMSYSALLPAFVDKMLHADASAYGAINALVGVGAVMAALTIAYFANYRKRGYMVISANLLYPLVLAAFANNTSFALSLPLAFGLGYGFMMQANLMNSLLQLRVADHMRGRVMSLYTLTFFGLSPFGSLAAGSLAEYLPLNLTISLTAVLLMVGALLIHWRIPQIRAM